MKIAFFGLGEEDHDLFKQALPGQETVFFTGRLDESISPKASDADVVCVFVESVVSRAVIDSIPHLKHIATRSTGYDHVDAEYAKSKDISVSNVPVYGSRTVAEFTFALLLTLSRKVREASVAIKQNGDFSIPEIARGFDLDGKTLGVVGTGKIGKNVISIARGFNMKVLAYDLYPDPEFAKENKFEYVELPELLAQSDIVTLHAPYTKENHHLINQDNISLFKKGAYLLNTARGELVDPEALLYGLEEGIIAGAGMDVLEGEKNIKKGDDIPFIERPNVILTPHVAFFTKEAEQRIKETTLENIRGFLSGQPVNLVK